MRNKVFIIKVCAKDSEEALDLVSRQIYMEVKEEKEK